MKRRDLERELRRIANRYGHTLTLTEGGRHSKAQIGPWQEPLPRHREVDELLARAIIRRCEQALKKEEGR
ncbi:hypothetical protein [Schaalia cardiffensis]|uniref:hypothetical protein n=1 Tax=Schaalia cardiffensis TaxID=181487 RepID=UPI00103B14B5|nr:hypothetical protein [Schaalia cardiffensis]